MLTDRELLELAAKAAGLPVSKFDDKHEVMLLDYGQPCLDWWNPLNDDGDALRLAVTLEITVLSGCRAQINNPYGPIFGEDGSTTGATRRSIVRAAAEIGKAM